MLISCLLIFLASCLFCIIFGCGLYFFPITFGLIILNIEILSVFKMISADGIIFINFVTLFITTVLFAKKIRNDGIPKINFKKILQELLNNFKKLFYAFKLDKSLLILAFCFLVLIISAFILCAFLPANGLDTLAYHAYRALVWVQKGHIFHFETNDIRNLVMPINSELIYTWIYALTKKDIGFAFLEFFSFIFGIVGIWALFDRLKITYRKRLWAIFVFSSFAGIISQISSTQSDLVVGTLLLYSILFFLDFVKENKGFFKQTKGYFSSLSFALALGVKSTAFMAGLPIVLLFLFYSLKKKQAKDFIYFICMLILNFFVFSSYNYILNFIDYLNPFGSEISINRHGFFGGFKGFIANFIRYNIQMLDFAGFKWGIYLSWIMFEIQKSLFAILHIPFNTGVLMKMEGLNSSLVEQTIGFGITGFLAFIPSVLIAIKLLIKKTGKRLKERWIILLNLGLLFYLNLIVLSFAIGYMVYSIRFITAFVLISSPVLIFCYSRKKCFYKNTVIFFCIFYMTIASGHLAARPLYKLIDAYKKENSYTTFVDNTRHMSYDFFKGDKPGYKMSNTLFAYIGENKTVGLFANDDILMHLTKIDAAKKHILVDELIAPRFDSYDIKKYDYIITPYPSQLLDEFNNKDKKAYNAGLYPKDCYFRENDAIKKVVKIECGIPYKKIEDKGFEAKYNIRIGWQNIDNITEYVQYIIWQNIDIL